MSKIMGPNPIKLEEELLLSWTPEQLDYMHDVPYWRDMVQRCKGATVLEVREMESVSYTHLTLPTNSLV